MEKFKFSVEYEMKASPKMLFSYFTTPAGLAQWFADDVSIDGEKVFSFQWDNRPHYAKIAAQRLNRYVKFEFLDDDGKESTDPNYIEFKFDQNELTQSSFVKITDYSEMAEEEDLQELWENLIASLKETVGG
ncbi:START-like domain-containing protein [Cytophagaceae bacterium DM2B3-1]|uniref:START-like domain-containing protein n=1 Tax=Xanthocytophaga flava TaxID=3048013 RepID=A0AAE3QSM3_9BACT|nr:START-like domain-containing protein [Xanthocytophaga flavus]MDJ1467551.1 START-like domain-containing protein [Xanthocytophaga flavus]MDJ1484590.1 START-like domain-containing protein [Xanthocytophaga flavus]MDJ1494924.1 START-like domain-containing protein [Xanthocytophaga flavus]